MKIFKKALAVLMASAMAMSSGALAATAAEATNDDSGKLIFRSILTNGQSMYLEGYKDSNSIYGTDSDDAEDSDLPDSYDLRDYGKLTRASSQYYGDCWSYATIASLESNSLSKGYGKNLFSRSHLCTFTFNPETEGPAPEDGDVFNYGGNSIYAAFTLANYEGIASRENFPDKTSDSYTIPESDRYNHDSGFVIDDAVYIDDVNDVKEYIMENGAAYVDYYSDPHNDCVYSEEYKADMIYTPGATETNHAVAIVGWDDTIPASEFTNNGNTPSVNGGWLIRNSWTDTEDSSYYMYISYGQFIENICGFSIREDTDVYNNYTYAPRGGEGTVGGSDYVGFGNVFTAEGDESINEVGFCFFSEDTDSETTAKVSIYKNLPDAESICGATPAYTYTEALPYDGLYTLKLPKSVPVSEGETYGVTVELSNDGTLYAVIEVNQHQLFHGFTGTYNSASGQSFARTDTEENYTDLYEEYNASDGVCDVYMHVYTSCNHKVTKSDDGLTNICSLCGKELPICETHTEGYTTAVKDATYTEEGENEICCTVCGEVIRTETTPKLSVPSIKIRNNPGTKEVKYGNYLKAYADVENGNGNCFIRWSDSTEDSTYTYNMLYFECKKDFTITAELVDSDGNPILDMNGNPIKDTENVTVKKNIFIIIITFLKNLFGISPDVVEN